MNLSLQSTLLPLSVIFLLLTGKFTHAQTNNDDGNDDDDGMNRIMENEVEVVMANHRSLRLTINDNGDLASHELDEPVDIEEAFLLHNDDATCFFWRPWDVVDDDDDDDDDPLGDGKQFLSYRFTRQRSLNRFTGLKQARRLYCFNHTHDMLNRNTFVFLLEKEREQQEEEEKREQHVIRIRIPVGKDYTQFFLAEHELGDLSGYRKIALLNDPTWDQQQRYMPELGAGCFVMMEYMFRSHEYDIWPDSKFRFPLVARDSNFYAPTTPVQRIVCMRNIWNRYTRRDWLQENGLEERTY